MLMRRADFSEASRLREPDTRIELFAILGLCSLFAMFFLLNSRFILPVGVEINLPISDSVELTETMGVLTVQSEKFIMFNGEIFSLTTLKNGIEDFVKKNHLEKVPNKCMLVRGDKSLPLETLIKICEITRQAGYDRVQLATSTFIVR